MNESGKTTCLSGATPILLSSSFECNAGFLCANNSDAHPPEFCPPTIACQTLHLQFPQSSCAESQGIYQPVLCQAGTYCPDGGREMLKCPSGYFCPPGTRDPIRCGPASVCPAGSSREFPMIGFIIIVIIDIALAILWFCDSSKLRRQNHKCDIEKGSASADLSSGIDENSDDLDGHLGIRDFIASASECLGTHQFGLDFEFKDVKYRPRRSQRDIISVEGGRIEKGSMWGIVGPSGAGKSTFVDVLSGHKLPTGGSVSINGQKSNPKKYRKLIGYVPQDDVLLPELTIRENIMHSASIHLPRSWTKDRIERHVELLLSCLGLAHAQHRTVQHISGGERKRTSIGMELVACPMALFLDEPSSGLDATSALSLVRLLKMLSQAGVTIICIIHQPRREIFEFFDNLLVLKNGRQVYLGARTGIMPFFRQLGYEVKETGNTADTILDIVSNNYHHTDSQLASGHEKGSNETEIVERNGGSPDPEQSALPESVNGASWAYQMYLCFVRALKQQQRKPVSFYLEIGVGAVAGLLIGLALYPYKGIHFQGLNLPPFELLSTTVDYKTIPMISLMCSMAIGLAAAAPGVRVFGDEKAVHQREMRSGHSPSAYYVGKVFATLPRILLSALHFTSFYVVLATPSISFWENYGTVALYFYAIYGLSSCVSVAFAPEDGPLFATILCLIISVLNGHGPPLATVHEWHLEWLWRMCPGTWFTEAYMDGFLGRVTHLYDVSEAAKTTKFVLGRFDLDLSMIFILGSVYRIITFCGLILADIGS